MNCYFAIAVSGETFELSSGDGKSFTINITNQTGRPCKCGVRFSCESVDFDMSYITPEKERSLPIDSGATECRQFKISFPATVPEGTYNVIPTVYDQDLPDEIFTTGTIITISVVIPQVGVEPIRKSERLVALVASIAVFCLLAIGIVLLIRPVREQIHYKNLLGLIDPKTNSSTPRVAIDFWDTDSQFESFLQHAYDNAKPSAVSLMWAIKRFINPIEKDRLLRAFGAITSKMKESGRTRNIAAYDDVMIQNAYDVVYGSDALEISRGCAFSYDGKIHVNGVDYDADEAGVFGKSNGGNSVCRLDLNCARPISRIELYDKHQGESLKGLGRFSLTVKDQNDTTVWTYSPNREYRDNFSISVPHIVGRYVEYRPEGSDFFSISGMRVYASNVVLDSKKTEVSKNLTDGDTGSYFTIDASHPVTMDLPKDFEVDRIELRVQNNFQVDATTRQLYEDCLELVGTAERVKLRHPGVWTYADIRERLTMNLATLPESKFGVTGVNFHKNFDSSISSGIVTIDGCLTPMEYLNLSVESGSLNLAEVRVYGINNTSHRRINATSIVSRLSSDEGSASQSESLRALIASDIPSPMKDVEQTVLAANTYLEAHFSAPVSLSRILMSWRECANTKIAIELFDVSGGKIPSTLPSFDPEFESCLDYLVNVSKDVSFVRIYNKVETADLPASALILSSLKFYSPDSGRLHDFAAYTFITKSQGKTVQVDLDHARNIKRVRILAPIQNASGSEDDSAIAHELSLRFINLSGSDIGEVQAMNLVGSYGLLETKQIKGCKTIVISPANKSGTPTVSNLFRDILIEGED